MKLTDLRDELTARANSTDETPDLLPGVRQKIARTKRRRTAGAAGTVGGLAVIALVASGIVPGLNSTTPQPADGPRDLTKDGVVLPGREGTDILEKGWIGDRGQSAVKFTWTPEGKAVRFYNYCDTTASGPWTVTLSVNDRVVGTTECSAAPVADSGGITISADDMFWLGAPAGKPAQVKLQFSDAIFRPVEDDTAQLALGIYQTGDLAPDGPPTQAPPTSAADYVKDGIRYRAKIGGDTLVQAKIGNRGETSLAFTFTDPGVPVSLSDFCTASSPGSVDPQYKLNIKINGEAVSTGGCTGGTVDAGIGSSLTLPGDWQPGQPIDVSVELQDKNGKRVKKSDDWIGLGIYAKGEQRAIGDSFLDELKEYNGRNYELDKVMHAEAKTATDLELATPADKPFLIAYGVAGLTGDDPTVSISGLTSGGPSGRGIGLVGEAARPAGAAKVTISTGHYTGGQLLLALYLPAD